MTDTDTNLMSFAAIADQLGVGYGELRAAIDDMRARPTLRLNGIPYFPSEVVERVRERLDSSKQTTKG